MYTDNIAIMCEEAAQLESTITAVDTVFLSWGLTSTLIPGAGCS